MESECKELEVRVSDLQVDGELPCDSYIELSINSQENLDYILFQNFYVASITIKQQQGKNWKTVLRDFKLTSYPHFENHAENWYIVSSKHFNRSFNKKEPACFRIYLNQPSPNWEKFLIRNITCYSVKSKPAPKVEQPKSAFGRFKQQLHKNLETLNSVSTSESLNYEDTMVGVDEVNRLEANII